MLSISWIGEDENSYAEENSQICGQSFAVCSFLLMCISTLNETVDIDLSEVETTSENIHHGRLKLTKNILQLKNKKSNSIIS